MNLFDSITGKSSVQGFFGKPETPSFMPTQQPVAPRTSSYTQPIQKPTTQLFQAPQVNPVDEQLRAKGYDDKDIEFLKQAKAKWIPSQQAFWYLDKKKQTIQPVQETSITDKFKMESSEEFWLIEWAKDVGKFFVNVPADSAQVVWWLYDAVRHPINTLSSMYNVWQGISDKAVFSIANSISSALWGKTVWPTENAKLVGAIWTELVNKYWTAGKFKKAVVENPADTLLTLMWWLWVVSKVAEANNMTNVVNNINKIQQVINPVNILKQESKLITKPIWYMWKEVIPQMLGKTTGTSAETIKTAFTQWWTPEFQSALRGETTPQNILSNVQEGMQAIKNDRAIAYWTDYAKLQANKTTLSIDDVARSFIKSLQDEYKIKVGKSGLDFSQSKITWSTSQSQIENMYKDIAGWKDKTPEWLDVLKQRLQDYYRGTPDSSKWDRLSTIASNAVKNKIVENVPEYANMTATYEKLTNDIRDITKTLSLWDKTQAQTAITKLSSVLRENFSARQDMVKLIEQYTGKNIQWQIAWASLNPLLAKWLAGIITGGWIVFWQLANPAFWWWLALASPRLIGEIANTIWIPIEKFKSAINNFKNANTTSNTARSAMEWSTKVKPFTQTPIKQPVVPKKETPTPVKVVTPKKITPTEKVNSTQANWPTVIGKMWKKTTKPTTKPTTAIKEKKPIVVPKKTVNTPIAKKSGVEPKVEIAKNELPSAIADLDRNWILQTSFEVPWVKIKWAMKWHTTASFLEQYWLSKNDFELIEWSKWADGLYVLTDNGISKLNELKNLVPKKITPKSNAKPTRINTKSSDTIPEGYFKNVFWEIIKNPSNKNWGFIRLPEIGKKTPVKNPLVEEARKYKSAEEFIKNKTNFVHETSASDIKEFDMNKIWSWQWESWLWRWIYMQEEWSFKIEKYWNNKVMVWLTPEAKIFKIKETPEWKWRDNFIEWFTKKEPRFEWSLEEWRNKKNVLPRDILMNRWKWDKVIDDLLQEWYDWILQDWELVIFNPKVLKTEYQLRKIYEQSKKSQI